MEELYNIINEQCNDQTENDLLNEMNENSVNGAGGTQTYGSSPKQMIS